MGKISRKTELFGIIDSFKSVINTEEMAEIIKSELKKKGINSLPCYANGGFHDSWDNMVEETKFLRVGLKNARGLLHHGEEDKEVLCVIGVIGSAYEPYRLAIQFEKLPLPVQVEVFRTCLDKKFKYPTYGCIPNKKFSKNNTDFSKLKPTFDKCYFADYDNSCYELTFNDTWDETGRPCFVFTKDGEERKVYFPEAGIYRISCGNVEQWGFDYAFSLDKEKLRRVCRGGFKHDYTISVNEEELVGATKKIKR